MIIVFLISLSARTINIKSKLIMDFMNDHSTKFLFVFDGIREQAKRWEKIADRVARRLKLSKRLMSIVRR